MEPHLDWPFFDDPHRRLWRQLEGWCRTHEAELADEPPPDDARAIDSRCRRLVAALGAADLLAAAVADGRGRLDVRALCLARERLAAASALADFAFALQGLGSLPLVLAQSPWAARLVPEVRAGRLIAAFALTEPEAGSDAAALRTTARPDPPGVRLCGEKTLISNGGLADFYVVFAREGEGLGREGIAAFLVFPDDPGFTVVERLATLAPHPLARLRFDDCRLPPDRRLALPGQGFRLAMATLERFRPSVGAAALGLARRALEAVLARARTRQLFGRRLGDLPLARALVADAATELEAARLLVYRAAWTLDRRGGDVAASSMAKLYATEAAQRVVDLAVQLWGGLGVVRGSAPERLYREIRALRIYEGASEVQRLVIGRALVRQAGDPRPDADGPPADHGPSPASGEGSS